MTMAPADRGTKHTCPDCAAKYYDLKRAEVRCPKCGAKPADRTASTRRGRRAARTPVRRYP